MNFLPGVARAKHSDRMGESPASRSVSIACKGQPKKAAGQQSDPEIVRTLLTMPQTIWEDLAASITSAQFNRG
jgi:hypothetical protein